MDTVGDHRCLDRVNGHGVGLPGDLHVCRIERLLEIFAEPVQNCGKEQREQWCAMNLERLEMELEKDDIRIRRLLGQKLQFITNDLIKPQRPDDNELQRYFKDNIDKYTPPERITMTQIFFDPDLRGNQTLIDAEKTIKILNKIDVGSVNAIDYGDKMMVRNYYSLNTQAEISRFFGSEFTRSVFELETKKWQGPILSGYGTHIVYLHDRQTPDPPLLDEVREVVIENWMNEKQLELNDLYYKGLADRFDIVIEETETDNRIEKKE